LRQDSSVSDFDTTTFVGRFIIAPTGSSSGVLANAPAKLSYVTRPSSSVSERAALPPMMPIISWST
jgi:hypothetical protein